MPMSFPVSFLLGRELSRSVGVQDAADQTASGLALAVMGGTPVGVVLARQLALNRVPSPPKPVPGQPSPGGQPPPGGAPPTGVKAPVASFTFVASDLKVQFLDNSTGTIQHRRWRFHDNSTSNDVNPTYTYKASGKYPVELTVTGESGASNTTVYEINVTAASAPAPAPPGSSPARIMADFDVAIEGRKAKFTDRSAGTVARRGWNLGDDTTSQDIDPVHVYPGAAKYDVTLTVTDENSVSNATTKPVSISDPTGTPATPAPPAKPKDPKP